MHIWNIGGHYGGGIERNCLFLKNFTDFNGIGIDWKSDKIPYQLFQLYDIIDCYIREYSSNVYFK